MNEIYEFEGTRYDVAPNRLEEFLQKFPGATKVQEQEFKLPGTDLIEKIKQPSVQVPLKREEPKPDLKKDEFGKEFIVDDDGGRMYFGSSNFGGEPTYLKEVDYDYDRSKGIRFKADSYGKVIDNVAYKIGDYV